MVIDTKQLIELSAIVVPGVVCGGAVFLYSREIAEALRNLRGGGPRPPSHPLPGNDDFILRGKRRPKSSSPF
jgi:hypothetical protein